VHPLDPALALVTLAPMAVALLGLGITLLSRFPRMTLLGLRPTWLLALALITPAPPARASGNEAARGSRPPWSWSEASGISPPRPLVLDQHTSRVHPALHMRSTRGEGLTAPLFPRVKKQPSARLGSPIAAHKRSLSVDADKPARGGSYCVKPGDTLWSIAAIALGTNDPSAIARYWPRIHHANPSIGPDPRLIFPGQLLELPK
jgi:LysM domain